jgi:hypothetical protein
LSCGFAARYHQPSTYSAESEAPMPLSPKLALLLILLPAALLPAQTTIRVPADQPTIQAGINAAANGDTVLVAPGTYYENISFKGKAITVTSSGGAASTIIDGNATPGLAVVSFGNNETRSSVLSNLTIRNGGPVTFGSVFTSDAGGGIYIYFSSPTILNNIITANECDGISANPGSPLIQGNTISATSFANNAYCAPEPVAIVLDGNQANMTSSVIGNTIENNISPYGDAAAAIYIQGNGNILVGNTIRNNLSTQGAVQMYNSESIIFSQNLVYGNYISGNIVGYGGAGGLYLGIPDGGPPYYGVIANNTFANNTTSPAIGGASQVFIDGDVSMFSFVNNILYGTGSSPVLICSSYYAYLSPGPMLVENNDVFNPSGPAYDSSCANGAGMAGNIAVDPLFNNAANNDFHLQSGSPAIDTGTNQALILLAPYGVELATDLDGNPRVQNGSGKSCTIDMGAFEYPGIGAACGVTETLQSSLNPSTYGQSVTFTAQLSSANGVPTGAVQFADGGMILGTVTISSSGASTYTTGQLAIGSHAITATYQPTGNFSAISAAITQVVNSYPTTTTLSISPSSPSNYGTPVKLTTAIATTVTNSPYPITGTVTFSDGSTILAVVNVANNSAAAVISTLASGSHSFACIYSGDANYTPSNCGLTPYTVIATTTATLDSSLNPSGFGQLVTFSALIQPPANSTAGFVTGFISFYDGSTLLDTTSAQKIGCVNCNSGSEGATFSTSTLSIGSHIISAVYSPTGNFGPSSASLTQVVVTVTPVSLTLTSALNPSVVTQPVTFTAQMASVNSANGTPTGMVTFYDGTTPLSGQPLVVGIATFTTSKLTAGQHSINAVYSPTITFGQASGSLTQVVNLAGTISTLSISPNPPSPASNLVLNAIVASTISGITVQPTGYVTFFVDGKTAGNGTVVGGDATISISPLSLGLHTLSCTYSGDANFAASNCNTATETVTLAPTVLTLAAVPNPIYATNLYNFVLNLTSANGPLANQLVEVDFAGGVVQIACYGVTNSLGTATCSGGTVPPGSYTFTAHSSGDSAHAASNSNTVALTVLADPSAITLSASPATAPEGSTITLTAQVTTPILPAIPGGGFDLYDNGTFLRTYPFVIGSGVSKCLASPI